MIIINENRRSWELNHSVKAISETEIEIDIDGAKETFDLSGFTEDEEYILFDSILLPYNPVQSIIKSENDFEINVFYDDPHTRDDFIDPFMRVSKSISIRPTKDNNIYLARTYQRDLISESWNETFITGRFTSSVIGIEVDCRRFDTKNDYDMISGIIEDYDNLSSIEKHYKGTEDTTNFECTLQQLIDLRKEMVQYVKSNLFRKRTLHAQIDSKNTISEVKEIVW